jgi:hypothetical protein
MRSPRFLEGSALLTVYLLRGSCQVLDFGKFVGLWTEDERTGRTDRTGATVVPEEVQGSGVQPLHPSLGEQFGG